ncbi:hypothetical protein [Vacuolonema iberomarrocanum]|uniref:hypothetical protein n=1 Tax=Vacuolonema iberomarrocanum TaxID=3454632 RepID=UPI0019EF724D|nr:hypothetical protein [filamentous cyanobacterium LEGE 07170]
MARRGFPVAHRFLASSLMLSLTLVGTSASSVLGAIAPNPNPPTQSSTAIAQNRRFPSNTLVNQVRRTASRDLDISFDRLHVLSYTSETWTDGCLGLGGPAELCLQAIVEGWKLEVTDGDQSWTYHTDETGDTIRLAENTPDSPDGPDGPDGPSNEIPPSVRDRLLREIARQLDIPVGELSILSYDSETWTDSCLGLGGPAELCLQTMVEGWQLEVTDGGQNWVYHADETGNTIRLAASTSTEIPSSLRDRLLSEVSRQLNIPVNELRVVSSESQVWDGCMGITPPPNQGCQEIAIWGWRAVIQRSVVMPNDTPTWVFHINEDATDVRLSSHTPPTNSNGIPRRMADVELQDWLDRQDLQSLDPDLVQQWVPTEDLITWLEDQWQEGTNPDQVQRELQAASWVNSPEDFQLLDVDGDGQDEWLLSLSFDPNPKSWGSSGDFWIIGEALLYRYLEPEDYFRLGTQADPIPLSQDFDLTAPQVIAFQDYTGDREPELLLQRQICGAHTCVQSYTVLSYQDGAIRSLISQAPSFDTDGMSVVMPYAEVEAATDETGDRRPDLLIRGGTYGSAGAGIQRIRTEIWAWDGSAMILDDIRWDPSDYRFHLLYEANYRLEQGDGDRAADLYRQVIEDDSLNDDVPEFTPGSVYDSSRQFAAFRLMVMEMMDDDDRQFRNWERWLRRHYPDASITEAARRMSDRWNDDDSRDDACMAAHDYLAALDDELQDDSDPADAPTGPLRYMGYGNPPLSGADVCPIDLVRDSDR